MVFATLYNSEVVQWKGAVTGAVIQVPEASLIVGCGDSSLRPSVILCQMAYRPPMWEIGRAAKTYLIAHIEEEERPDYTGL